MSGNSMAAPHHRGGHLNADGVEHGSEPTVPIEHDGGGGAGHGGSGVDDGVAVRMAVIGDVLMMRGEYAAAEKQYRRALNAVVSEDHRPEWALAVQMDLGVAMLNQARFEEAGAVLSRNYESKLRVLGSHHRATVLAAANLAVALIQTGPHRFRDAAELLLAARSEWARLDGEHSPHFVMATIYLADLEYRCGEYDAAASLYRAALHGMLGLTQGAAHPEIDRLDRAVRLCAGAGTGRADRGRLSEPGPDLDLG